MVFIVHTLIKLDYVKQASSCAIVVIHDTLIKSRCTQCSHNATNSNQRSNPFPLIFFCFSSFFAGHKNERAGTRARAVLSSSLGDQGMGRGGRGHVDALSGNELEWSTTISERASLARDIFCAEEEERWRESVETIVSTHPNTYNFSLTISYIVHT